MIVASDINTLPVDMIFLGIRSFQGEAIAVFDSLALIVLIGMVMGIMAMLINEAPPVDLPPPTISKRVLRKRALREHVAKAGGTEIHVKRVGIVGTYLEHFLINYRDSENSWQVRHVIRKQIAVRPPSYANGQQTQRILQGSMKERYYWDDPVVTYEREVSAEISQSKQQLINDLDVEVHQLRQDIAAANSKVHK